MFGKSPRGISERPKASAPSKTIPSWMWTIFLILLVFFAVITTILIWQPWTPVSKATPVVGIDDSDQPQEKQNYRFYDLLPKQKVTPIPNEAVPEQTNVPVVVVHPTTAASASSSADSSTDLTDSSATATDQYILQIGSFSDPDAADAKRASVIFSGLSAEVVVSNQGKKLWYRVISGPYNTQKEATEAQQILQNSSIDAIVVKR